ncbi:hypothetical protein MGYG_02991 [Nannizzia gypsea CBS 118893]|uniref:Uncharacterized protein n=1 Tax=Arthroderma gypseum (strain ATCC MYA-4604 / CBS 118893) TaxID=535722 RepID=E4UQ64_ARTGP|nr:hypothetical protein MGYG_02991 [Nannizzia gypsea CBS 118893]EFQ99983.1 hypothetical protein MGYG_02991 [Nannizzia gypsea CBS 118893]
MAPAPRSMLVFEDGQKPVLSLHADQDVPCEKNPFFSLGLRHSATSSDGIHVGHTLPSACGLTDGDGDVQMCRCSGTEEPTLILIYEQLMVVVSSPCVTPRNDSDSIYINKQTWYRAELACSVGKAGDKLGEPACPWQRGPGEEETLHKVTNWSISRMSSVISYPGSACMLDVSTERFRR